MAQTVTTTIVPPEEDEFEDIEDDGWDGGAVDPAADIAGGAPLWETGWDDDAVDEADPFTAALKAALDKGGGGGGGGGGVAPPQQPPAPHHHQQQQQQQPVQAPGQAQQ